MQEGGLLVRNVTHLDAGKYTCRAFETTSKSSVSGNTVIDLKVRREYIALDAKHTRTCHRARHGK